MSVSIISVYRNIYIFWVWTLRRKSSLFTPLSTILSRLTKYSGQQANSNKIKYCERVAANLPLKIFNIRRVHIGGTS